MRDFLASPETLPLDRDGLLSLRSFLDPRWVEWKRTRGLHEGATPSFGMCRLAAGLLCRALFRADAFRTGGPRWIDDHPQGRGFRGPGGFDAPPGFRHPDRGYRGTWRHHSWIELDGLIFDIAADQFDPSLGPLHVTASDDPRYSASTDPRATRVAAAGAMHGADVEVWIEEAREAGLIEALIPFRIRAERARSLATFGP